MKYLLLIEVVVTVVCFCFAAWMSETRVTAYDAYASGLGALAVTILTLIGWGGYKLVWW